MKVEDDFESLKTPILMNMMFMNLALDCAAEEKMGGRQISHHCQTEKEGI